MSYVNDYKENVLSLASLIPLKGASLTVIRRTLSQDGDKGAGEMSICLKFMALVALFNAWRH